MTQQFDEGVKEVLMALLSLGALKYEADYVTKMLNKRTEPVQEIIQAVKTADEKLHDVKFDQVAKQVINKLTHTQPVLVKPNLTKSNTPFYIYTKLIDGGLTPTAAAGIVANIKAESEFNPKLEQEGGGPGRGLVQWEKGGRFNDDPINLVDYAAKRGKKWTDLNTQIDFILYELHNHPEFKRVLTNLNNAKTAKQATLIFLQQYEKAGKPHTEKRVQYANEFVKSLYKQFKA